MVLHPAEGNKEGPIEKLSRPLVLLQRCATASGSSPDVCTQTSAAMQMLPRYAGREIAAAPSLLLISVPTYKHEQLYADHMLLQAFAQVALAHQLLVAGPSLPAHAYSGAASASRAETADLGTVSLQVTPYSRFAPAWQPSSIHSPCPCLSPRLACCTFFCPHRPA